MPRVTVVGLGAVGGAIAAALSDAGVKVRAVARGAHGEAVARSGLRVRSPSGDARYRLEVAARPDGFGWGEDDVLVLATKTQDTAGAVEALAKVAPASCRVVCAQNGLVNERLVGAVFRDVYPMMVYAPLSHLTPGVVETWATHGRGILSVGHVDGSVDAFAASVSAALGQGGFDARAEHDTLGLKQVKLLYNLGNVLQLLCGPDVSVEAIRPVRAAAMAEGVTALEAAGLDVAGLRARFLARADALSPMGTIDGQTRRGGSTWQSGARQQDTEVRYLNGEVVAMAARYGLGAPVNAALVALDARLRAGEFAPGSRDPRMLIEG